MHKYLASLLIISALSHAAEDSSAYWQHLQLHPDARVQKKVELYRQGLCTIDDILKAEETQLLHKIQTANKQQYKKLGQQLIRNYREQLRLEELRGIPDNAKIPQIKQKLYELEARMLQTEL